MAPLIISPMGKEIFIKNLQSVLPPLQLSRAVELWEKCPRELTGHLVVLLKEAAKEGGEVEETVFSMLERFEINEALINLAFTNVLPIRHIT